MLIDIFFDIFKKFTFENRFAIILHVSINKNLLIRVITRTNENHDFMLFTNFNLKPKSMFLRAYFLGWVIYNYANTLMIRNMFIKNLISFSTSTTVNITGTRSSITRSAPLGHFYTYIRVARLKILLHRASLEIIRCHQPVERLIHKTTSYMSARQ
jgi:hypothetical protein